MSLDVVELLKELIAADTVGKGERALSERCQEGGYVQTFHALVGVMMAHQIRDPGNLLSRQPCICKKTFRQRRAFRLLVFPVGIAVFDPAQRASNIMDDGRNLRDLLQLRHSLHYLLLDLLLDLRLIQVLNAV